MTVTALEISLNDKVLYTVGMEDWIHLSARIMGGRITKEMHEEMVSQMDEIPADFEAREIERLSLSAHVGVPKSDGSTSSTGQSYRDETLSVGDVVTIRVIKTDSPDLPEPSPPDDGLNFRIRESAGDDKD